MITSALLVAGILSGLVLGAVLSKLGVAYSRWPYALIVIAAAVLYPVLQSPLTPQDWRLTWYAGIAVFATLAFVGSFRSPWWIAVGLLLHGAFDLATLLAGGSQWVGHYYGPWCAGLDFSVAGLFILRVCITPEPRPSTGT